MATRLLPARPAVGREHRFFVIVALVMALTNVAGFSLARAVGISSFSAPWIVHLHALISMGWVMLYLVQTLLGASGTLRLHRRLGWVAAGWMVALVAMGTIITVRDVRLGRAPFFFTPGYFLVMNPGNALAFAGLSGWAIALRHRTDWHTRLHLSGMAMIMGPALGRLIPLPLLMPHAGLAVFAAMMLFPLAGVVADWRRTGRVHPAWWAALAVIVAEQLLVSLVARSAVGAALYAAVTAGSPGAAIAPSVYPPPPWA